MIAQYKHDMQLVDQLTADAEPHYEIEQELYKSTKSSVAFVIWTVKGCVPV